MIAWPVPLAEPQTRRETFRGRNQVKYEYTLSEEFFGLICNC